MREKLLFCIILFLFSSCFMGKKIDYEKSIDYKLVTVGENYHHPLMLGIDTVYIETSAQRSEAVSISPSTQYQLIDDVEIHARREYRLINKIDTTRFLDNNFGIIAYNIPE